MMKKRVLSIVMALALCLSLCPVGVLAAETTQASDVGRDETRDENPFNSSISKVYGTLTMNKGKIIAVIEGGTVGVNDNHASNDPNDNGHIVSNAGTVNINRGYINVNSETGTIGSNLEKGEVISNSGTILSNAGYVGSNYGTVGSNYSTGTITNNLSGVVNNNAGKVSNWGTVTNNNTGGVVFNINGGTVTNNNGGIVWWEFKVTGEHAELSPTNETGYYIQEGCTVTPAEGYYFAAPPTAENATVVFENGAYTIKSITAAPVTLTVTTASIADAVALVRVSPEDVTYYTDIQEAWTAATEAAGTEGAAAVTLTLLKDVTANKVMEVENGNITFSGGQYTLTGPERGQYVFCAKKSGTLTINSGTVKGVQKGADVIWATGGGTVVIAGGTINATNCSGIYIDGYDDSDRGTAKITGGTIKASAYGINKSKTGTLELSGGTISSGDKAIVCTNSTLRGILKNDGAVRYAYYRNNTTPITDGLYDSVLSAGSYTVKPCGHERAATAPIAGTEAHGVSCPACGYTADAETCAYETWVDQGDGTHKGVCVCGREKTEAHTCAEKWSPVWNEREVTITYPCEKECGYTEICGKVTVSADHLEIPYAQTQTLSLTSTLPDSTFTWTVSSGEGGGEAADTPLSTESSCTLPGDWNVGEYHVSWAVAWTGDGGQTVDGGVVVTVTPATLTGKPAFGSGEGKTLGEVEVTYPESWPEGGTFAWEAGAGTQVVRGTSYAYTYTSPDGNYAASGSVVLWAAPSTGGGGGGYVPPTPPVSTGTTTEGGTPTTETTAVPTASVSGGKATATVDTSTGGEIVKQAVANDSETVVIAPKITGDVSKTEVSIPASTVGQLGSQTSASLTVSTPVADVTIPNGGLGSLGSAGGTVIVAAEKTGNTVELTVTAGGRAVESVPGGVTLTVPAENTTPGTVAVLVHGDGTREVVRKSAASDGSITIPLDGPAKLEIVDNSKRFDDVPATGWVAKAAAFVSSHELFQGTAPGRFSPDAPMSRGMLAVVLHNLENNPAQALTGAFADVSGGQWYAEGVAWAEAQGIIGGYGNGRFGPNDSVTREQLAVMLWRYAGSPAATDRELHFADADRASDWAVEALCWATENGILDGKGGGILEPTGQATRAETAQMLMNFMEKR